MINHLIHGTIDIKNYCVICLNTTKCFSKKLDCKHTIYEKNNGYKKIKHVRFLELKYLLIFQMNKKDKINQRFKL